MAIAATRVLLVEDNLGDVDLIREELSEVPTEQFVIESVDRLWQAILRLTSGEAVDVVLLDLGLPDSSGLQTLVELRRWVPRVPVVILTGSAEQALALGALRAGAQDYLIKGESGEMIRRSLLYAIERRRSEAAEIHAAEERAAREAAEDARRRLALLAEASVILAASQDYDQMWSRFAEALVPRWADWCVVALLGDDQSECGTVGAHRDPAKRERVEELWRRRSRDPSQCRVAEALRTRRSVLLVDVPDSFLVDASRDPESVRRLRDLGARSAIVVPLVVRSELAGVLAIVSTTRPYGPADLAMAEDLGRRAAVALESSALQWRVQAALREAENAVRLRDEFLSIASHELRTPLGALVLHLQTLQETLRERTEGAWLSGRIAKAVRSAFRVSSLIDLLLDVTRAAAGRLDLHPEPLELGELVAEVSDRFTDEAHLAGCALRVETAPDVTGEWDRLRLEQVLANLLSNAIKYGAGLPIAVVLEGDEAVARLSVQDRGIGIAPEDISRIFNRFERAESARHTGGLGLGLWIARQIVEAHGGRIGVTSTPGAGSTFTVELPRHRPEHAGGAEAHPA